MSALWPSVPLGEVIDYRKEFIIIDDLETYRRPRVQLHAQGIVLRDAVLGVEIKTKKQQVARAGEFLVAEIDAKVGGFGIVPDELDGSIVSSHYFLYSHKADRIDNRYLGWFVKTRAFRQQVEAQGSTNYAAIRPNDVLGYKIPLPSLDEQRRIVARIEDLLAKIAEARTLRALSDQAAVAFVAATHAALATSKPEPLSSFLELYEDATPIEVGVAYPQAGVRGFGGGLFAKPPVHGGETTYRSFNRLYRGALVMSQVKGWEGAIAMTPKELHGYFVSPEYRTFRCKTDRCLPGYLAALVPTEFFWGRLKDATRGVGARRERTRPEQFLQLEFSMPSLRDQEGAIATLTSINAVQGLQRETATGMNAMLPGILDKAFRGDLS
jgi:type I restriction enzyme S subunit